MCIVKFKDGTFGIRKFTSNGYRFKDLTTNEDDYWWKRGLYLKDTRSQDEDFVRKWFDHLTDNGKRIDK
jgi:hypothetical protein